MLIKAKNKVNGSITEVPERYLKFNDNYKKATKNDLKKQDQEPQPVETDASEDNANG